MFKLLPRYDSLDTSGSDAVASSGVSTGQNAINSFDPTQTSNTQKSNLGSGGLGGMLGGETGNYVNDYSKAVANNPTVTSLYNTGNNMFNVPNLQKTATNLNNEVTNAVPDAYSGARGFDIGNTQVQNGVAAKESYLLPQADAATANANTASGLASNFVNAGQTQNAQNLLPIQAQAPLLQNTESAQASGWNQASQQELAGLMDKMNQGVTLSQNEISRANTLATAEEAYQQAVTTANIGNQFKDVGKGDNLVNTFTQSMMNPSMLTANTGVATYG